MINLLANKTSMVLHVVLPRITSYNVCYTKLLRTNIQPWHFIIADTKEGKARVAKGAQGFYQFNEKKIMDASHVIVFCARTDADNRNNFV